MKAHQPVPYRPPGGVGHYLRDIVYGALDGVITTLAVISGVSGAGLDPRIGLILAGCGQAGSGERDGPPHVQSRQPCEAHVPHERTTCLRSASRARNTRTPALLLEMPASSA